jgi:hypothetical protein
MTNDKYIVVEAFDKGSLETKVNDLLKTDYKLIGGIAVIINGTIKYYYQAMLLLADSNSVSVVSIGKKGGDARALALSASRRTEIARKAAMKRWVKGS